jgi:2-haloacid dehalogenase
MKKYSWLLFDADGTLFDFDKSQEKALENVFSDLQLDFQEEYHGIYSRINKAIWEQREQGLIGVKELKTKRFENFFKEIEVKADFNKAGKDYLYFLSRESHLLDGAENLVQELAREYNLVLITNGLTTVQKPRFNASPITRYFKEVIISEEVGFSKPQKEIFDLTFDRIKNPPKKEVVIIGDNLGSDILGGITYGIDTIWYNPTVGKNKKDIIPTFEVNNFNQLSEILRNINS